MLASSSETRCATTHFSLQVLTNSRYFCRLSKKRKLRCGSAPPGAGAPAGMGRAGEHRRRERTRRRLRRRGPASARSPPAAPAVLRLVAMKLADAVERLGGDAAAVAKPARELAVVDGAPAEGGFGQAGLPAIVGDFLQQFLRVHAVPGCFLAGPPSQRDRKRTETAAA